MDLIPFQPFRMLSRWPDFWDDQDFAVNASANNLDLYETEDEVVVKTNVAGVGPEDIDLTFEDGILWIKAAKVEEQKDEDKTHYAKSSWSYSYKVAIPGKIDPNKEPQAEVDNGVLTVTFEKSEVTKPKKLKVTAKNK
jgi:HSP20 family protein